MFSITQANFTRSFRSDEIVQLVFLLETPLIKYEMVRQSKTFKKKLVR